MPYGPDILEEPITKLNHFLTGKEDRRPKRSKLKMNIGDTSGLKDEKRMDSNKVWQWRIMLAKKYSISPEPFRYSNEIGLNFNVASNTQQKLDLDLVTNGVILEVCDFAKTVIKGKGHFITQILENNFDLGLENEQHRVDFTAQILHKVKDLIRKPPEDKHKVFMLFDKPSNLECTNNSNNGLHKACREGKTEGFPVEIDDTDDSEEEDGFNYSQAASKEYMTENLSDFESDESKQKCSGPQAITELKEVLPFSFPYCEEIGLSLDIGSKQSLDIGLFTKGVMLELVHFTRVLTASYNRIILDVLEHNFELDLKNEQVKNQVLFKVSQLLKRRKRLNTTGNKTEFKNEPFAFQTNPFKGPRGSSLSNEQEKSALLTTSEQGTEEHRQGQSKHMETNTLSHKTTVCTSRKTEGDHSDTYAQEESALDSDKQGHLKQPKYTDVPEESESSCLTTTDISSTLPIVSTIVNQPFESQPDKRGFCGDEEETQTPRSGLNKSDIEQKEMGTEHNMWKLRSNRVEQILSALTKDFGRFNKSKGVRLEYNVGFGPNQNISVESLKDPLLLEIGKFAVAMNSSQKDFIMEILEYNFDLNLPSQHHRNIFASDIMTRVRQLRSCGDAVKFSNEVFELPGLVASINMTAESEGDVSPELGRSEMGKCDVASVCPPDSHAETKEHISCRSEDLYPLCKEIGLNLHVNNSQSNKKLEINKLTNGALTEVTNFAEKLCGTFEQICLDILRHNLDFDLQRDSELAKNIFARISTLIEQRNRSTFPKTNDIKLTRNDMSTVEKQDCPDNLNIDTCSAGSSQAAVIDQNVGRSTDTEHQNDLDLKMWKLRANHIQRILSMPHQEHCPLYSYSRCKKLGIDFNVGSGIRQNLDPKLLTNGIMVELNTFATALLSAQKHFITEILEHNFDLHFENELHRSAFAVKVMRQINCKRLHKRQSKLKNPFGLPDVRYIEEPSYVKTLHCPKCYQDQKFHEDESDPGHMHHPHPHTMSDTISADVKCTTQKLAKDTSSAFSTTEETIMDSYPHCKKIGFNLCVDKDLPKDKLDMHVLTNGAMMEVVRFAKKLCGTIFRVINDVLEHNFNIGKQSLDLNPAWLFFKIRRQNDGGPAWFNKVFVIQSYSNKPPAYLGKVKQESVLHRSERMEIIRKRQLALQAKQERANMPSGSGENPYPVCTAIGLDLDVMSNSREKVILDLKLLTKAVVFEIHTFATLEAVNYYPRTVFDILDYNFDLSSQHYRRWEFSVATALKIQTMVKEYCKKVDNTEDADEVFKLPFDPETSQQRVEKRQNIKGTNSSMDTAIESNSSCVDIHTHFLTSANMSSLPTVNSNVTSKIGNPLDERGFYGDEEQTQTPRNAPNDCNMEQEEIRTENYYTCPLGESDLESDEVSDSENTGKQNHIRNPESFFPRSDIASELESSCIGIHAPFFTSINYQSDIEQEEMGTEHNMWKLRSNRVEQILSALTKDFGLYSRSKRVGLEYNVGFVPKRNVSVDSLKDPLLLEIGKFALAMNSSQKDFIMEILEYNFDLNLPSQHHRNIFASDIMTRVRQLRSCGDAVKFLNEVFELPGLVASINMTAQSEGDVSPELGISKMGKCDVAPVCPPDSHAETKEHMSCRSEDLYPLCKEIGLNLHVNNSQSNKKLEINKLTNGAMTEVANFAEKLCGTFEQICLDILRHNLDFDLQRHSELAKNILARISALIEQTMEKQDCPDNQNVGRSTDTKHQNDLDLKLWKLRVNHIQRILSMPHEEHCPLDSYSRCKKLGIDFNVGSGIKKNLDPKLLTNGIMVELNTFATALSSAQKHFIPEILEHNFDLNFRNELSRSAFTDQVMKKINSKKLLKIHYMSQPSRLNKPFELPDVRCIEEPSHAKTLHCPKCYQDQKFHEDEPDPGHMHHPRPHTMSDIVSAEVKCTTQKHAKDAPSIFSTTEEKIMDRHPHCKKIGLNLCVDKDPPKDKLDMHVLTIGAMTEVFRFTKKLCGTNFRVINDVLEHNFNIGKQSLDLNPALLFYRQRNQNDGGPAWFNKVFVIQSYLNKPPAYMGKVKWESVVHTVERMENIKRASNHGSGDEEVTQTLRNSPNKSDIEQEEMGTEHNMWKLRSATLHGCSSTSENKMMVGLHGSTKFLSFSHFHSGHLDI